MKRLFDCAAALAGLILLAPVFLAIAVSIALDDGFPLFFAHRRVGRGGKTFRLWKFRSMRSATSGAQITAAGDTRVTRMGRIIRRYKLDELPQLWNVLRGDMSLVGPRPEVPEYVNAEDPVWRAILSVRPGITDLASLLYRDEEAVLAASADPERHYRETVLPEKLALSLKYTQKQSLYLDFKLIVFTVYYSFFPSAFHPDRVRAQVE